MRTATALWEKRRVPRAAIAILASRSTQLRRPTSVSIVNLHYHVLSAQECVQPVKDVARSHTYALYGPGTGLQCRFVVTSRSLRSSALQFMTILLACVDGEEGESTTLDVLRSEWLRWGCPSDSPLRADLLPSIQRRPL